jgi:hypothetical protein
MMTRPLDPYCLSSSTSSLYCGVKPHCDATLTSRITLPAYFESFRSRLSISCMLLAAMVVYYILVGEWNDATRRRVRSHILGGPHEH